MQVSPFFASILFQIEYSETPKYSEQYFRDRESGTKVNICNFSLFEAVTNFLFIAACNLPSSSALFLASLSYIGDGSSIYMSQTLVIYWSTSYELPVIILTSCILQKLWIFVYWTSYELPFTYFTYELRVTVYCTSYNLSFTNE